MIHGKYNNKDVNLPGVQLRFIVPEKKYLSVRKLVFL